MKPIIRNFLSVIHRFKMAVVLNILGLSVAFAAFMVIMIQLNDDFGFDKFHKDYDKIFRVEVTRKTHTEENISRPLAERFFDSSPHILAGAIASEEVPVFFHVENDSLRNFYEKNVMRVSSEFANVFTFDFVEGAEDVLKTQGKIFIPQSLSSKIFGKESAIGQQLVTPEETFTVGAVYCDFPANSILNNPIYIPMSENEDKMNWGNFSYVAYIRVSQSAHASMLFENFKRNFDASVAFGESLDWDESGVSLRLTALPDIHFVDDVKYDRAPKTSKQTLLILFAIAIVIIAIAAINFTNFSTALTPMRIKNINTQRVLGARRSTLRWAFVVEAIVISFLSYLVAILLVDLFSKTQLANLVDADLSIAAHPLIIGGTAWVALLAGLLAGVYPAHYMTSFAPALILKGSFGLSPKGKKLRNMLVSIQYFVSFVLIICASFMYLQNHFMQNSLGYDKDNLLTINIERIERSRDVFTNQLKGYSGIENIAYGESLLSSTDYYQGVGGPLYNGEQINFRLLPVDDTFLKLMGIEISDGRDFRREDAHTQYGALIFNETAHKRFNLEIGTRIDGWGEIIGFIPDVKFASLRIAVQPMAFHVKGIENGGNNGLNNAYIKVKAGANMREAMSHIHSTLAGFDTGYTGYSFDVRFFDEVLQRLYEKETSLSSLISLFSLLAIFISIVGVFGLVVFDSECRRKEIGIRKVLGATTMGIIVMFNKAYFRILLICFVVATPLAWYAVTRWLENFAYKTPMYWWVYALAFVVVAIITSATVTFQNWRVASDNPLNAIKTE